MRGLAIAGRGKAGFLGLFLLEELKKQGCEFHQVAASGTAALASAFFYSTLEDKRKQKALNEIQLQMGEFNKYDSFHGGLLTKSGVENLLFTVPLTLCSIDIDTGELILFKSQRVVGSGLYKIDNLSDSLKASCALGGLDSVYLHRHRRLIDSYCKIGVPVSALQGIGEKDIFKVNLMQSEEKNYGFFKEKIDNGPVNLNIVVREIDFFRDCGKQKIREALKEQL